MLGSMSDSFHNFTFIHQYHLLPLLWLYSGQMWVWILHRFHWQLIHTSTKHWNTYSVLDSIQSLSLHPFEQHLLLDIIRTHFRSKSILLIYQYLMSYQNVLLSFRNFSSIIVIQCLFGIGRQNFSETSSFESLQMHLFFANIAQSMSIIWPFHKLQSQPCSYQMDIINSNKLQTWSCQITIASLPFPSFHIATHNLYTPIKRGTRVTTNIFVFVKSQESTSCQWRSINDSTTHHHQRF